MTKRRRKQQNMVLVRNKPGMLIQKPPIGVFRPFISRVYNGKLQEDGTVVPYDRVWEVPADQYHLRKLAKGELLLADKPKKEEPKKVKDKK